MKLRGDAIPGLITAAVGGLTLWYVLTQPSMVIIGESSYGSIGPGFLPFVCAVALIVMGGILFIRGLVRENVDFFDMTEEKKANFKKLAIIVGLFILMIVAWRLTNQFIICLFVYCILVNLVLKRSLLFTAIFSVVLTGFIYLLFCVGFKIMFNI